MIERIYIGGLDPSRGLTVEIVVSKLKTVSGVEILSINDVPITTIKTRRNSGSDRARHSKHHSSIIYKVKGVVDEDGDIVDTRNFFYLEARRVVDDDDDDEIITASDAKGRNTKWQVRRSAITSALELLARQYNGVKWKGCNLRVEPARPHFLTRLEEERSLRDGCINDQKQVGTTNETRTEMKEEEEEEGVDKEVSVIKNRRRLRIRKAFGEEAFHVDTYPHVIEINNQNQQYNNDNNDSGGWDTFATSHKRLHDKYQSQYKKMIELRKKERRLWATSGGGEGTKHLNLEENTLPSSNNVGSENNDEGRLRSLIFLNRAIHVRFSSNDDVAVGVVDKNTLVVSSTNIDDSVSITSSPAVSSTSDESDNEGSREGAGQRQGGYVWSDDDSDGGNDNVHDTKVDDGHNSSDALISNDERDDTQDIKYNQHDDEYTSSNNNNDNEGLFLVRRKKIINESEYTRVATIDEFMDGMDFDIASNDFEGDVYSNNEDGDVYNDDDDDDDNSRTDCDVSAHICLDDDIRSNMDVLSQLFPDAQFNNRPLAPSTIDGDEYVVDERNKHSSSVFGTGLIVQRYDPTKETEQTLEMKTDLEVKKNDHIKDDHHQENASLSNKRLDDECTADEQTTKMEESDEKSCIRDLIDDNIDDTKSRVGTNIVGKVVPAKDVYEQDALEEIFEQARGGKSDSFSFGSLFQTEEKLEVGSNEQEIYEQDKLEQVFKQSKRGGDDGGFSFGFINEQISNMTLARDGNSVQFSSENTSEKVDIATIETSSAIQELKSIKLHGRKTFSKCELDEYEKYFFSLNEGSQILSDLDGMKNNEENQERWQKERAVLTADWKRKQKSALSKKGKKKSRI